LEGCCSTIELHPHALSSKFQVPSAKNTFAAIPWNLALAT
jgi:hypothetical protein